MMLKIESYNLPAKKFLKREPLIAPTAVIRECEFGIYTEVQDYVHMDESTLGDFSYVCMNGQVIYTEIGKFANIASFSRINPGAHPMERPSLHHFTYRMSDYGMDTRDDEEFFSWRRMQKVKIGHDTWIGHGVVIMPGVSVGNGAVVGSNSVVTKDVPPYSIVAGAPAKVLRRRFPADIAEALERIKWWDWDYELLSERSGEFKDIRSFIYKYGK